MSEVRFAGGEVGATGEDRPSVCRLSYFFQSSPLYDKQMLSSLTCTGQSLLIGPLKTDSTAKRGVVTWHTDGSGQLQW
jgi:hypothetical protein